jgi:hypothetical protein
MTLRLISPALLPDEPDEQVEYWRLRATSAEADLARERQDFWWPFGFGFVGGVLTVALCLGYLL